jgi:hypothetical protein
MAVDSVRVGAVAQVARSPNRAVLTVALAIGLFGVASALVHALTMQSPPPMTQDSSSYLTWLPNRSPGYPAFLSIMPSDGGFFSGLWVVQAGLFIVAIAFLAYAISRLAGRRWPGIAAGVAILLVNPFWKWSAQVRPESLCITLLAAFLAAAALTLVSNWGRWFPLAGVALGAAILVRPAAMGFAPALAWLALWQYRDRGARAAALLVIPPVAMISVCAIANGVLRGYYAPQAYSGLTMLGKVAPLLAEREFDHPIRRELAHAVVPLRREVAWADGDTLYWLSRQGYDPALNSRFLPWAMQSGLDLVSADWLASDIASAAIRDHPWGYIRLAATQVIGMWTWPWITTKERVAPFLALLSEDDLRNYLGPEAKAPDLLLVPPAALVAKTIAAGSALVLCLGLPILALWRRGRDRLLVFAGTSAIAALGYTVLVGSVLFADNRYAYVVLPLLAVTVATTFAWATAPGADARGARGRRSRRRTRLHGGAEQTARLTPMRDE